MNYKKKKKKKKKRKRLELVKFVCGRIYNIYIYMYTLQRTSFLLLSDCEYAVSSESWREREEVYTLHNCALGMWQPLTLLYLLLLLQPISISFSFFKVFIFFLLQYYFFFFPSWRFFVFLYIVVLGILHYMRSLYRQFKYYYYRYC